MPRACWEADPADGSYWIDVALGGRDIPMLIDLGMIDSQQRVGFSLDPAIYDSLKQLGSFSAHFHAYSLDASGNISRREHGLIAAQLIDPRSRLWVGPLVQLYASRGAAMVPNRVGVPFFHQLIGCRVVWDLNRQRWCISYP